jgi:two-component system phosphate regulon sensor histidine kinase PhoR
MLWPSRSGPGPSRNAAGRPALRGATIAAALLLMAIAWRGQLDLYVWAAALLGLIAGALVGRTGSARRGPAVAAEQPRPGQTSSHEIVAHFPDPAILLDGRAIVVTANAAALRLLPGLTLRQPLALALRAPEVLDSIANVLATGEQADVALGGRGATEPAYEVRLRPLEPASRGDAAIALFFRDLTPERRIETMRVDFVANVSHELRTPLASLVGFIDTLQGPAKNDPAARERFLVIMRAQAARMTRLIADLLQLSRVELNAHVAPSESLDLGAVVAETAGIMAPLAHERGVALAIELPEQPILMLGDHDEMIRLVENLLENAIKYGGSGGQVQVAVGRAAAEHGPRGVELTVGDRGPGIPPEHLPRLTERFYRVDTAESRNQGGTGLGLAIVKHIVARHRGRLTIESTPGVGTLVRVTVPEHRPNDASVGDQASVT